jgi:L-methionine (R)-S-oxide reductase
LRRCLHVSQDHRRTRRGGVSWSDEQTKSEIVCPLILRSSGKEVGLGVFNLDCLVQAGFDENDKTGLEKIAQLIVDACDW